MALKFVTETIFKGKDEQSKQFNKMGKNAKKFGETSSKAFKKASKSASMFGSVLKANLASGAITKGLGLLKQGLAATAVEFVAFDDSITAASAKFKGLDLSTKQGQKTLAALRKEARKVGAETKFSATEAAGGLDFYATAGFNAAQAMAVLKPTAKLATIANLDLARTSDIASDSIGAFGMMTKDSAQLQKNFTRISDVMAKTMTSTNTGMEDMFESIKKGAPAFTAAGQSLESFNTLMGVMANSGVKGAESGTQLRNMMLQLSKPTKEAEDVLGMLGVKTKDQRGNFRDIIDIIADFEKGLKGMGTANQSAAIKTVFGARSVTGFNILLKEGTKSLRSFRKDLINAGGSTEKMAAIMDKSLGNKLKGLKSAAIEVGFKLFEAFSGEGSAAIDTFTNAVRNINMEPIINGIRWVANLAGDMYNKFIQVGESTGLFDKLKNTFDQLTPVFNTVVDIAKTLWSFLGDTGALDVIAKAFGVVADSITLLGKAFSYMWTIAKPIVEKLSTIAAPIFGMIGKALDFVSGGISSAASSVPPAAPARQAPNAQQLQNQKVMSENRFAGRLDIAGAPDGSKYTPQPGADPVDVRMLGGTPAFGAP